MKWQGRRGSNNIVDRRSLGAGSMGIGGLVIGAVIYFLMGGNPLVYLAQNAGELQSPTSGATMPAEQGGEENDQQKQFVAVVLADTEDVWTEQFTRHSTTYQAPKLVLFRRSVRTACGSASSATGPFYCPRDQQVYLDLSFFDEMSSKLGAQGDLAAAYVIAHEVGHHVQTILGLNSQTERQFGGRSNQASVAIELQADCLSGIWASQIERKGSIIEPGDIEEALNAASAVGDDRLQSLGGGEVAPDSFTHGSSAQRVTAFKRGYESGNIEGCLR